jgi:diguanylate cyclase (GGDEF)-like protein
VLEKKFDELRLTGALPSPSSVGLRILEITQDDGYEQEDLVRTIMVDPALSGRIIHVANTADKAGGGSAVETVHAAAMRLGGHVVRSVALGFTLVTDNREGDVPGFDYDLYWARSLATAVAASALALEFGSVKAVEAFTCGLLADIGKLALASVHPQRYGELMRRYPNLSDIDLAELETRAFDINHLEVAALMMADWGLPEVFSDAARRTARIEPRAAGEQPGLDAIVHVARRVAELIAMHGEEHSPEWLRGFFRLDAFSRDLGLEHARFLELLDGVITSYADWATLIGVPAGSQPSFVQVAADLRDAGVEPQPDSTRSPAIAFDELSTPDDVVPGPVESSASAPLDGGQGGGDDAAPTRLLLIDDDERMLRLIGHHLRKEGYEVDTATSSEDGLRKALSHNPQILITDWMMPGMTGVELCSTLRQTEAGRKVYVLIVTAREDDERVVEAFSAGADDYIVKPFNPRILIARVRAGQRMVRMRERVEESERAQLKQVAELGILTRRLRVAALTDVLTKLPNRRYAMQRLKQEWDSSTRTGQALSVIMCDIDHFKHINDEAGHDVGDAVLREVACILGYNSRSGDVLARVGGEEFLSINVSCDRTKAVACAERLRRAIAESLFSYEGLARKVTMSFGVAQRTPKMTNIDNLIKAADEALYLAKNGGRNRVDCAPFDDAGDERASA